MGKLGKIGENMRKYEKVGQIKNNPESDATYSF